MNDEEREMIREKLEFYKKEKIKIFVKTTRDFLYSGEILEISDSMFIINERLAGRMILMFSEIMKLEPWIDREKKEEMNNGPF